jgi:hypothetical protein
VITSAPLRVPKGIAGPKPSARLKLPETRQWIFRSRDSSGIFSVGASIPYAISLARALPNEETRFSARDPSPAVRLRGLAQPVGEFTQGWSRLKPIFSPFTGSRVALRFAEGELP